MLTLLDQGASVNIHPIFPIVDVSVFESESRDADLLRITSLHRPKNFFSSLSSVPRVKTSRVKKFLSRQMHAGYNNLALTSRIIAELLTARSGKAFGVSRSRKQRSPSESPVLSALLIAFHAREAALRPKNPAISRNSSRIFFLRSFNRRKKMP